MHYLYDNTVVVVEVHMHVYSIIAFTNQSINPSIPPQAVPQHPLPQVQEFPHEHPSLHFGHPAHEDAFALQQVHSDPHEQFLGSQEHESLHTGHAIVVVVDVDVRSNETQPRVSSVF
jgi:hypothetical protein